MKFFFIQRQVEVDLLEGDQNLILLQRPPDGDRRRKLDAIMIDQGAKDGLRLNAALRVVDVLFGGLQGCAVKLNHAAGHQHVAVGGLTAQDGEIVKRLNQQMLGLCGHHSLGLRGHDPQVIWLDGLDQQGVKENVRPHVFDRILGRPRDLIAADVSPILGRNQHGKVLTVAGHVKGGHVNDRQISDDAHVAGPLHHDVSTEGRDGLFLALEFAAFGDLKGYLRGQRVNLFVTFVDQLRQLIGRSGKYRFWQLRLGYAAHMDEAARKRRQTHAKRQSNGSCFPISQQWSSISFCAAGPERPQGSTQVPPAVFLLWAFSAPVPAAPHAGKHARLYYVGPAWQRSGSAHPGQRWPLRNTDNRYEPDEAPPRVRPPLDCRLGPAASRHVYRCYTASLTLDRTHKSRRGTGSAAAPHRSQMDRSSAASVWPAGYRKRWPPAAAPTE